MSTAQIDAPGRFDVLLKLDKDAVRLFAQQPKQLRLNLRRHPAYSAMATLPYPLGLTRAKTLRADLLRIVIADRKPLRKNAQRTLPPVERHKQPASQIIRICFRHQFHVAVRQSQYSVHQLEKCSRAFLL